MAAWNFSNQLGPFAKAVFEQKYAQPLPGGGRESWPEAADRVVRHVMAPYAPRRANDVKEYVTRRQLMPAGRYLYCAGRRFHQTNNCFLFAAEDTREGWADLMRKATTALMTGGGVGVVYSKVRPSGSPVGGMGGTASGPLALMEMVNEVGRRVRQGGSRRSALWAGLHWDHPDCMAFVSVKDWPDWLVARKAQDFNTPAPMDGTNVSVVLDDEFFRAYAEERHAKHSLAQQVYWRVVRGMCKAGEPGFSVDCGEHAGENLRNAPVAANTHVLTDVGYVTVGSTLGKDVVVWTGKRWARTAFKKTGENVPTLRVKMTGGREIECDPSHPFLLADGTRLAAERLRPGDWLMASLPRPEVHRDRLYVDNDWTRAYLYGLVMGDGSIGRPLGDGWHHAELSVCCPEKRPCAEVCRDYLRAGHDGRGHDRYYTRVYLKSGHDKAALLRDHIPSPECDAAFLAGWFDTDGSYDPTQHRLRLSGAHHFLCHARRMLETLGIRSGIVRAGKSGYTGKRCWLLAVAADSVSRFAEVVPTFRLRPLPHDAYRPYKVKVLSVSPAGAQDVFCCDVRVEEHSFVAEGVVISNCTEVVSRTDSDVCNLASLNLARFRTLDEFVDAVDPAVGFLLCNTLYSDLPLEEMRRVRDVNRRLGLGLMGLHEWLLVRKKRYGPDAELAKWLEAYAEESDRAARRWAKKLGTNVPIALRAVAPTGTISILAETTSGVEPIFAAAFKRRYLKGDVWHARYVIDQTAKRAVERGVPAELIEDAYDLAGDPDRRLAFQAFVQQYVDQGISSTINLPAWGTPGNCEATVPAFGATLLRHLPSLRGVTAYPDGSRGGQPLTKVPYAEAAARPDVEFEEHGNTDGGCAGGVCGV